MTALAAIVRLWRRRWPVLALGMAVAVCSSLSGAALLALAGAHVAVMLLGAAAAVGGLLTVLGPVRVVLRYLERLVTHAATFRALADLRVWFFSRVAARSAGGLGMQRSGDLAARLVADVEALDGLYLRIAVPLLNASVLFLVLVGLLVGEGGVTWLAGLAACLLFAAAAFAAPALAARVSARGGEAVARESGALRTAVVDALTGLREVRLFAAEPAMLDTVRLRDAAARDAERRLAIRAALAQAAGFVLAQAAILVMLFQAEVRPVFAVGAVFLLVAAFEVAGGLPRAGVLAGHASAAARRVLEAARNDGAAQDPASPAALPTGTALRFEGVRVRWRPELPPVLDGLTFEVPQGARVAVLGPSGSGKSTLAALLPRIAQPEAGRILLGGTDIATLPLAALRGRFAWLSQATHLFDDTIRANLLLGRPEADEASLWAALDQAEIGEFVRGLPDGLDTWLGESGARVSGGQGRRIALARALVSAAPILVLDEPGAGLDAQTERALLQTLTNLPPGRTVLLVTHRLLGVERLDRIWRLSSGMAVAAAG